MNDLEEFKLLLDDYNSNHSDAILLISNHLSKKKIIRAETVIYDKVFFAIKATDGNSSFIMKTNFSLEGKTAENLKKYFFKLVYQARRKIKDGFPKTRIEMNVEKSSSASSRSFFSRVKKTNMISTNIREITFEGDFKNLKTHGTDDFMLVIVPQKDSNFRMGQNYSITDFRRQGIQGKKDTAGAFYTIRQLDDDELKIWFVLHDHPADLGDWAKRAELDDEVILWGPRSLFNPPENIKHLILFCDESGLPAMQSISEHLNDEINCMAFYEVLDENCCIPINLKRNVKENWIYREKDQPGESKHLLNTLKNIKLPKDNFYIFGAGEAFQMIEIKNHFMNIGVLKDQINVSGYWKRK